MTQILAYHLLTGFTDVYNKKPSPKKAPGHRLFSAVLVQARKLIFYLQNDSQMQLKAIVSFEDFRELPAV